MSSVRYIFSINTGRSGSDYLATLLRHAAGCQAFHEATPKGNKVAMRSYLRGDPAPMRECARQKARAIERLRGDCEVYAETNHCFIKGFGWFLPEHLPQEQIGVVVLSRDESKIVESFMRIGTTPLSRQGRTWIMTPEARDPLVPPPGLLGRPATTYRAALRGMHEWLRARRLAAKHLGRKLRDPAWTTRYQLDCLHWYVAETRARTEAFKRRFPRIRYFDANVDDLNSLASVREMFEYFGLRAEESLPTVVGRSTNARLHESQGRARLDPAC